jgi:hypothetical protein
MTRRRLVRVTGLGLAATFAVVGVIFVVLPEDVLAAFNSVGGQLGLPPSTTAAQTLYLALAIAYMYRVTALAVMMARHPDDRAYPSILAQAKAASALVCLVLFVVQEQYAIYLANFVVDGAIAAFVFLLALRSDRAPSPMPTSPRRDHLLEVKWEVARPLQ